ncbi:MAG: glycosyltransferase family 2 protein [Candidatus Methanoperedens sp.]|nr:glycosyltransferase family 2 protein [Candidatus Methanoperedens sp.]
MTPKVSVIIPLYNKGNCVERTLRSILKQTYQDFEIIVVDDGSTDNGPEIVKKFIDPRINLIQQDNRGPGAARNIGLTHTKGEYVVFLDADDEWLPEFLQRGLDFLTNNKGVATISSGYYDTGIDNYELNKIWDRKNVKNGIYELSKNTQSEIAIWLIAYMIPCTTFAKKNIIKKYGGFFDKNRCLYGEDAHLWLKILLNEKIGISREKLVIIHRDDSSLSSNLQGVHPIPPLLIYNDSIDVFCPIEKKNLLKNILAIYASRESKYYAIFGQKIEAASLLKKFCSVNKPREYYNAKFVIYFSFIIPYMRPIWRKLRNFSGTWLDFLKIYS